MPKNQTGSETHQITPILDVQYFPSIPYFTVIVSSEKVLFETHENFIKQSYRNRCRILTANGKEDLVIPLKKPQQHVPIQEIQIDNTQGWANKHWKTIQAAYGKSPWFYYFKNEIKDTLLSEKQYLLDFNLSILNICYSLLGIPINYEFTSQFLKILPPGHLDLRSSIHPKKTLENLTFYSPARYVQNFSNDFVESLSIIDLIFSEGPESLSIIKQTIRTKTIN